MSLRKLIARTRFALNGSIASVREWLAAGWVPKQPARVLELAQLENRVMFSAAPAAVAVEGAEPELEAAVQAEIVAPEDEGDATGGTSDVSFTVTGPADSAGDEAPLSSDTTLSEVDVRHELVFLDTGAGDYEQLLADLTANDDPARQIDVVLLDATRDGVEQITQALAFYDDLDAVHVVSHGTGSAVKLGGTWLGLSNLDGYVGDIAGWQGALASGADLLFYGCDLASTADGRDLMDAIGLLTGADVAASSDDTGHALLGGDWDLEYETGAIETAIAFSLDVQADWHGLLDTFTVINTNNSGAGSLRQAIDDANALAGVDTIAFNIGGGGLQTISLSLALPTITEALVLDATTQSGYAGSPLIVLDGGTAGSGAEGFHVTGGGTTIRGFVIQDFGGNGIELSTAGNNAIEGNYIGTNAAGDAADGNGGRGIFIGAGADDTRIGGTTNGAGNVISGNLSDGIWIDGVTGITVVGNRIGTTAAGTAALANAGDGIDARNSTNVTIGGTAAGAGNILSGTTGRGIVFTAVAGGVIEGNSIGTNADGTLVLANGDDGITLFDSTNVIVGSANAAGRNVISGNVDDGVHIRGGSGNVVIGNYIGTNASGTAALGNQSVGVQLSASALGGTTNNRIGGSAAGEGNVISGNLGHGISVIGASTGNIIEGNYVGTNAAGDAALANGASGIDVGIGADGTRIGGAAAGARNVISGNTDNGIRLTSVDAVVIQGNYIGTTADGLSALGNNGLANADGIDVISATNATIIGNVISDNRDDGIDLNGGGGHVVQGNLIGLDATGTVALGNQSDGVIIDLTSNNNTIGGIVPGE
ncbi:MAG: DUF4347 domain-containing protein, partial [Planctomycetes bacterium]|nr:DUF4347 domain-containing protein [Planctomycetota bacterium]